MRFAVPLAAVWFTAAAPASAAQQNDTLLTVRVGEALVPPREYAVSDKPVDPSRRDLSEAGRIYDIVYDGLRDDRLRFKMRGFAIDDLTKPAFSQNDDRPATARRIVIRDIAIEIVEADTRQLRYRWKYLNGDEPGAAITVDATQNSPAMKPGALLSAAVSEALVPPREYGFSAGPIDPSRHDPIESGRIYDVAYAGFRGGRVRFELRGYSIDDLTTPASGQYLDFPAAARRAVVKDIVIEIVAATAERLRYRWKYVKRDPVAIEPMSDPGPEEAVDIARQ